MEKTIITGAEGRYDSLHGHPHILSGRDGVFEFVENIEHAFPDVPGTHVVAVGKRLKFMKEYK